MREEESTSTKENLEFSRRKSRPRILRRRGDQQFSCMERSSYCKEMRLPGSCYGTFQISKLASSGLRYSEILAIIKDKLMGNL